MRFVKQLYNVWEEPDEDGGEVDLGDEDESDSQDNGRDNSVDEGMGYVRFQFFFF